MTTLERGAKGPDVERLQHWLTAYVPGLLADGSYGVRTEAAVRYVQQFAKVPTTGTFDAATAAAFHALGFVTELPLAEQARYPLPPAFASLSSSDRQRVWGAIVGAPTSDGGIEITNGWNEAGPIDVPQLAKVPGANKGRIWWHRRGTKAILGFFADVEREGKLPLVLSWAGSWCPRYVRGSRSTLSAHAHASAFDINAPQNPLGAEPATGKGCVFELVPIAHRWGFFWGGHFERRDGMHFELTRVDA